MVGEVGQEIEATIVQALCHEARREALRIVNSNERGASYTELMAELGLPTGKLNYHLRQLDGFVVKNTERRYVLTPLGRRATNVLASIAQGMDSDIKDYVKTAQLAQKRSLHPLVRSAVYIGMVMISLIIFIWGYLFYLVVTEGAPPVVYVLLPILISIGFAVLGWLIYALKSAPEYLKRFERRLVRFP